MPVLSLHYFRRGFESVIKEASPKCYCDFCGKLISRAYKQCPHCKTHCHSTLPQQHVVQHSPSSELKDNPAYVQKQGAAQKKKSRSVLPLALGAAGLAGLGGLGYLGWKHLAGKGTPPQPPSTLGEAYQRSSHDPALAAALVSQKLNEGAEQANESLFRSPLNPTLAKVQDAAALPATGAYLGYPILSHFFPKAMPAVMRKVLGPLQGIEAFTSPDVLNSWGHTAGIDPKNRFFQGGMAVLGAGVGRHPVGNAGTFLYNTAQNVNNRMLQSKVTSDAVKANAHKFLARQLNGENFDPVQAKAFMDWSATQGKNWADTTGMRDTAAMVEQLKQRLAAQQPQ